jgi:hypothetical protein
MTLEDLFSTEIVELETIDPMAFEIYNGSFRVPNDFRPQEVRLKHAREGKAVEQALVQKGATYNPLVHDPNNPNSFGYDVTLGEAKVEVKRMILGKNDSFLSFDKSKYKNLEKYAHIPDLFIGGLVKWKGDKLIVDICLVTTPQTLFEYSKPSKYKEKYGFHNFYFENVFAPKGSYTLNPKILERQA